MRTLKERRFRHDAVEPGRMGSAEPVGVGVIREADDRHIQIGVGDIVGIDARDIGNHEVGRLDPVRCFEPMLREERLEFASEEHLDPTQEDRRHA